ncbi:MAG: hypothetical protein CM15mV8_1770 [Caudoviricetes sp.]|nr:MAG: hypothetical protein CM15mV8_1770 [Caudoviricetes sp.]
MVSGKHNIIQIVGIVTSMILLYLNLKRNRAGRKFDLVICIDVLEHIQSRFTRIIKEIFDYSASMYLLLPLFKKAGKTYLMV